MRCSTSRRPSSGVRLVTDDKCAGMLGALEEVFRGGHATNAARCISTTTYWGGCP